MRKLAVSGVIIASLFILAGCKYNDRKEASRSSTSNSDTSTIEAKLNLAEKEYDALVGMWECIDPDWSGEKIFIKRIGDRLSIQYDGEDAVKTECVSKSKETDSVYYNFENIDSEMMYMFDLKTNGNMILNRGTTNPKMTGLSKPMEYKKIAE